MSATPISELMFVLEAEDGWPPVAKECIPAEEAGLGYRIKAPPLFIEELSVNDVIAVERNDEGEVTTWKHIEKSARSTAWVMALGASSPTSTIERLKKLGCNVAGFEPFRLYAIDVPAECSMEGVDACLNALDAESVAIAFPSFRH